MCAFELYKAILYLSFEIEKKYPHLLEKLQVDHDVNPFYTVVNILKKEVPAYYNNSWKWGLDKWGSLRISERNSVLALWCLSCVKEYRSAARHFFGISRNPHVTWREPFIFAHSQNKVQKMWHLLSALLFDHLYVCNISRNAE